MGMTGNNLIGISGKIGSGKDSVGYIFRYLNHPKFVREFYLNNLVDIEDFVDSNPTVGGFKIKKFADKLKEIVCLLIGCTREQLEDRDFKETELSQDWWYWKLKEFFYPYHEKEKFIKAYNEKYVGLEVFPSSDSSWDAFLTKLTPRRLLQLLGTEAGRQIIHPNIWVNALFADYKKEYRGLPSEYEVGKNLTYPNWIITDVRFPNEVEAIKQRGGKVIRVVREFNTGNLEKQHESEVALDNYNGFDFTLDNTGSQRDLVDNVRVLYKQMGYGK